jgi:hypothetical protein
MRIYASLMLLVVFAVLLPGGSLLLPLAYAKYRRITDHNRVDITAATAVSSPR